MTVQDLIEALQQLPASADTSTVFIQVNVMGIETRRVVERVIYESGVTVIKQ